MRVVRRDLQTFALGFQPSVVILALPWGSALGYDVPGLQSESESYTYMRKAWSFCVRRKTLVLLQGALLHPPEY